MKKMNMKKIVLTLVVSSLLLSACHEIQEDSYSIENSALVSELDEMNQVFETTTQISQNLLNMGVKKIIVENNNNSSIYRFETFKEFRMNSEQINWSNYTVELTNGFISQRSKSNLKIGIRDNQPIYKTSNSLEDVNKELSFKNNDYNILLIFLNELTMSTELKINSESLLNNYSIQKSYACSIWDEVYVYSFGGSRSSALENLGPEIDEYSDELANCTVIGGIETSCVWGNHMCVATQSFCCE